MIFSKQNLLHHTYLPTSLPTYLPISFRSYLHKYIFCIIPTCLYLGSFEDMTEQTEHSVICSVFGSVHIFKCEYRLKMLKTGDVTKMSPTFRPPANLIKHFTIIIYDSRVELTTNLPIFRQ